MPIPKSDKFESLLASLSVTRPDASDRWQEFVAAREEPVNLDGHWAAAPAISFWYREESDLRLERLLQKIAEELNEAGYPADEKIAATYKCVISKCQSVPSVI
jgi:hypothetical protein